MSAINRTGTVADIPDKELVGRAVRNARPSAAGVFPRWSVISDAFSLGSTYAAQLCVLYELDPDELLTRNGVAKRK